jgi:uncharacterized protein YbjT (DUF2867 family)
MILVTGSSGTIGSELVKELTLAGAAVRAGYRTRPPSAPGVQGMRLDLATGEGLDAAVAGTDAVFLLVGEMSDQTAAGIRVVESARRAGVKRLVKLSVFGAEREAYSFARIHRPAERAVEASGIPYTLLRPVSFMQNFVTYYGDTIRQQSAIYLPCGDAREGHVDARDIARVAARVLTSAGHEGKSYVLTGPELLSYSEAADKLSAVLGRTIVYVNVSEADHKKSLLEMGVPADSVDKLLDLYRFIREGRASATSTAIKDVTGRDPISFDQFAREHVALWAR